MDWLFQERDVSPFHCVPSGALIIMPLVLYSLSLALNED